MAQKHYVKVKIMRGTALGILLGTSTVFLLVLAYILITHSLSIIDTLQSNDLSTILEEKLIIPYLGYMLTTNTVLVILFLIISVAVTTTIYYVIER